MGSGVQGQLCDEHHHLLAFGKGILHKVKCSFQRGAGGFLCLIPSLGKGLELCAQEVKGGLCAHRIGAAQLRIPAAEGGIYLQAGIQRVMAQQTGGTLALGLGIIVRDHLTEQGKLPIRDVCRQGGKALFGLPQEGIAGIGDGIGLPGSSEPGVQTGQDQTDQREPFIKRCIEQAGINGRLDLTGQDLLYAVVITILIIEIKIGREVLCDLLVLEILPDECFICLQAQRFIGVQQVGQILPAAGSDELCAVHVGVDLVEVLGMQIEVAQDGTVDVGCAGVILPYLQVGLNVHPTDTIQRDDIEITDRFVILRRVACRHDDPAGRHGLVAEGLALQELQHGGGQRLGNAVDLVDEENALFQAGGFHLGVDAGNDLAHGVFGHRDILIAVMALPDEGQAHGALAGVVGDGVGYQCHAALPGGLLHDLGLADARRAHQQDGPLPDGGNGILTQCVLGQVGFDSVFDFFFGTFDIHKFTSSRVVQFTVRVVLFGQRVGQCRCGPGRWP